MLDPAAVGWVVSVLILLLGAIFVVLPCWVRLWQWRSEHHIITKACLLLLVPDLVMIADFVPIHIKDLAAGVLVDDEYCKASSFLICACILASNVGNITVAYVTRRMLDPRDQKVTTRTLYVSAAIGWTLGLALAGYFLGQGYLGSHRGVYCCTNQVRRGDIAGPVFFVYLVCIAAMVYLYQQAYVQVATVIMPSTRGSGEKEVSLASDGGEAAAADGKKPLASPRKPAPAIASAVSNQKSSESREAEETILKIAAAQQYQLQRDSSDPDDENAAAGSPTAAARSAVVSTAGSPTAATSARTHPSSLRPPQSRGASQQSAAASIARRAIFMVLAYYACWSLISLNAVFELAGWQGRSVWWDVVAAWASKLQPTIDAAILLLSMTKVHELRQKVKLRNAESSANAPRVHVKVDAALHGKTAAAPHHGHTLSHSSALSPSQQGKGRLVSNGAVSARGPPSALVVAVRPASPNASIALLPALSIESSQPLPPPSPSAEETMAAEAEADTAAAAGNTVTHRRTVSSEIVQYQ